MMSVDVCIRGALRRRAPSDTSWEALHPRREHRARSSPGLPLTQLPISSLLPPFVLEPVLQALSADSLPLTSSPRLISLDNFNTTLNSSRVRNIRTREVVNMKRASDYKTL